MFKLSRGPTSRRVISYPCHVQTRNIITAPSLRRVTTGVFKGIALFSASTLIFAGGALGYISYNASQYQHIASQWPFIPSWYFKYGVCCQEASWDELDDQLSEQANDAFTYVLREVGASEGEELIEDEKKFRLLPLDVLATKSKEWQSTYFDLIIRSAISKARLGDSKNASKIVLYSTAIPIDIGAPELRSKSLRLLAKILLKGDTNETQTAENYLIDAVRFNEIHQDGIHFKENGSVLLDTSSKINRETFESLLDLGVLYSKGGKYSQSLEIFLNLLQITETENFKTIAEYKDEPLLKNYVSELLYKKGMIKDSLKWAQDAYTQASYQAKRDIAAALISKQALTNCIALYKALGNDSKAQELERVLSEFDKSYKDPQDPKDSKDTKETPQ